MFINVRESLTKEMKEILNSDKSFQIIVGKPGTNTSLLAFKKVKMLLEDSENINKSIIYISYNKPYVEAFKLKMSQEMHLRGELKDYYIKKNYGSGFEFDEQYYINKIVNESINTYNKWLYNKLNDVYRSINHINHHLNAKEMYDAYTSDSCIYRDKDGRITNYDKYVNYDPGLIREDLQKYYNDSKPYTYFIIDQANSIPLEIIKVLKDFSENMILFLDDCNTSEKNNTLEDFLDAFNCKADYIIEENNRSNDNTKAIINNLCKESLRKQYVNLNNEVINKCKTKVLDIGKYYSKGDYSKKVKKLVNFIVNYQDDKTGCSTGVLLPYFSDSSIKNMYLPNFNNILNSEVKSYNNGKYITIHLTIYDDNKDCHIDDKGLFLFNYNTAKKLEFDNVILMELNNPNFKLNDIIYENRLLVALTRSKGENYFIYDSNEEDNEITKFIKSNKDLFEEVDLNNNSI